MPLFSMWESLCIFGLDRERKAINLHVYSSVCRGLFVVLMCSVVSDSLQPHGPQLARLLCPRDYPGKSTGVGCHSVLQQIFPTRGSNPGIPLCRQILYHLSHQGSPRIQEWVTHPSPENRPDPGIKPRSSALQGNSLPAELPGKPIYTYKNI